MEYLKRDLAALLTQIEVPWTTWSVTRDNKRVPDLLRELRLEECTLTREVHPKIAKKAILVRNIECAVVRLYCEAPQRGNVRATLVEYKRKKVDGLWHPRTQNQGSISEKIRLGESLVGAVGRGLWEELKISLELAIIKLLLQPTADIPEPDLAPSNQFPGIWTRKILHPSVMLLPEAERNYKHIYLERASKSRHSPVTSAFIWWNMDLWAMGVAPPPVRTLRELAKL
jgi:hypothetical protein